MSRPWWWPRAGAPWPRPWSKRHWIWKSPFIRTGNSRNCSATAEWEEAFPKKYMRLWPRSWPWSTAWTPHSKENGSNEKAYHAGDFRRWSERRKYLFGKTPGGVNLYLAGSERGIFWKASL